VLSVSPAIGVFIAFETFALTWAFLACNKHKGYALVLALGALLAMALLALLKGWVLPAAVAQLKVRGHVVLTEHEAHEQLLSAARGGDCWHVAGATQAACPCPASKAALAADARRQDMRFLRGPVRVAGAR
jgi:hypothetical protein